MRLFAPKIAVTLFLVLLIGTSTSLLFWSSPDVSDYTLAIGDDKMHVMELEEYLGELRYYDEGFSENKTPNLLAALDQFKEDIKSESERNTFSLEDYQNLRGRYWLAIGEWLFPEASYFYFDAEEIIAHGMWQNIPKLSHDEEALHFSKIYCSVSKGKCLEQWTLWNTLNYSGKESADTQGKGLGLNAQPVNMGSLSCEYKIIENNKDFIKAISIESLASSADKKTLASLAGKSKDVFPYRTRIRMGECGGDSLNTLILSKKNHSVLKNKTASARLQQESKFSKKRKTIQYTLIDPKDRVFSRRYKILQHRYYPNKKWNKIKRANLLEWMKKRDIKENKERWKARQWLFMIPGHPKERPEILDLHSFVEKSGGK